MTAARVARYCCPALMWLLWIAAAASDAPRESHRCLFKVKLTLYSQKAHGTPCTPITILSPSGDGSAGVLLQRDGVARPDSGLTWRHSLPAFSSFTLCVRLFSLRHRYADYFFSYATQETDNELALRKLQIQTDRQAYTDLHKDK